MAYRERSSPEGRLCLYPPATKNRVLKERSQDAARRPGLLGCHQRAPHLPEDLRLPRQAGEAAATRIRCAAASCSVRR